MTEEQKRHREREWLQDILEAIECWFSTIGRTDRPQALGAVIQRHANLFLFPELEHYPYCEMDLVVCKFKAEERLKKLEYTEGWLIG